MRAFSYLALVVVAIATITADAASATTVLKYQGNQYNEFTQNSLFSTSNAISLTIRTEQVIGKNYNNFEIIPTSFSIDDGMLHIDNQNYLKNPTYFRVWTNSVGKIFSWGAITYMKTANVFDTVEIQTVSCGCQTFGQTYDGSHDSMLNGIPGYGSSGTNFSDPGVWTISVVPEPASWTLIMAGFGGLGMALRGKRRKLQFTVAAN